MPPATRHGRGVVGKGFTLDKGELATIGATCRLTIAGRYPLNPNATKDVALDDFTRLFAPDGTLDAYFRTYLAPLVDTSSRPWKFKPSTEAKTSAGTGLLAEFERAKVIRDTFFADGKAPSLKVEMKMVDIDPLISRLVVRAGTQSLVYEQGETVTRAVRWPAGDGPYALRLETTLSSTKGTTFKTFAGPWALFRLFDAAKTTVADTPERFVASFLIAGDDKRTHAATVEVRTGGVRNPFAMPELRGFSCPSPP